MTFGGSPLDSLINGLKQGASKANAAVGAAQSGVNAVLAGGGVINNAVANMNTQAGNVVQQGNEVNQTADEVKQLYSQLGQIAELLGGKSGDLWNIGQALSSDANDIFGQGKALLNMDPNAGGLVGEFIKYWQSLSPDRYVSQAASDAQAAGQNAKAQAMRDLTRRGVSASSGAFGALQKQFATLMATASAAAKTRARQIGLDAQAAQLGKMTEAFNALYDTGNKTQQSALAALGESINANKAAADTIAAQGQGYSQAGSLQQSAGQLFSSAASIFGDAGNLQTNYLSLINNAYGNLSSANIQAADYFRSAVATEVSAVNGGGGGGGGGSVSSAPVEKTKSPSGAWVDLNHGKAARKNEGANLVWDPNA